jgi:hypothetical protein
MERVLGSHLLWTVVVDWLRETVKEGVGKSNHPIENPLLLVTEPQTRDNITVISGDTQGASSVSHNVNYSYNPCWTFVSSWLFLSISVYISFLLATDPEVPGSIPGATRFSKK